jgi:Tol biopolymer transport system component/predicted Ser/Thr protein kinase
MGSSEQQRRMTGRNISHYQILEKLGEGGMGVVYRARDTHLDRTVAIKLMRGEAVADADRKRRFVQEAKTASALNHPNIITIYDIDNAGGVDFIAMEYVEGRTLDRCVGHKGVALGEALRYSVQITDALAAAHQAGIVHRDLKPGNIMVTEKGQVKVLDFGLAKLTEPVADDPSAPTEILGATGLRTEEGMIVGTIAYMSPEQAEGRKVDRRSDIFSFGAVLYEMITGRRPFQGQTKLSTLSAILHQEPPPPSEMNPSLPREFERILTRCLRKDPDRRFQHMDDVKVALQEVKEESESGAAARTALPIRRRQQWLWPAIAAGVALLAAGAGIAWWLLQSSVPTQTAPLTRLTSDAGLTWEPAVSPDGKLLAYSSDRSGEGNLDIWVQQIAGGEPIRLTGDPADEREPAFSSDGSRIAFRSDREGGAIYVVPALGGEPRLIAKDGHRPCFSPDDNWIAYWVGHRGPGDPTAPGTAHIYVAPSTGGPPRQLQPGFATARYPVWSPDGKRLLFWGRRSATGPAVESLDWWVAPLDGGEPVRTGAFAVFRERNITSFFTPGVWTAGGNRVLFSAALGDSTNLWQVEISPRGWKVAGPPQRLTFGTDINDQPSVAAGPGRALRLVFSSLISHRDIWSLPINTSTGRGAGELRRLTQGGASVDFGSLSADGKRLVFASSKAANSDIWFKNLESGKETDLTPTPADEFHPRLAADASKVVYSTTKDQLSLLHVLALTPGPDGTSRPGVPERACEGCRWAWSWSSDGKRVLFSPQAGERAHIAVLDVSSGEKTPLLTHPRHNLYQANFSPDDRWIAFLAGVQPPRSQIFVVPAQAPAGDWIPVTEGDSWDDKPRWSPTGNLLYFTSDRDGFRCLWARPLEPLTKRPAGPPFPVYHFHSARRSLMNVPLAVLEPSVARDKIVFNLGEITGNIWMAPLEAQR